MLEPAVAPTLPLIIRTSAQSLGAALASTYLEPAAIRKGADVACWPFAAVQYVHSYVGNRGRSGQGGDIA
jgi:hypothetical protein